MSSSPRHRSMLKLPRRRPQACTSLIGVVDVKLLLFTVLAGYVASAGHALLFAVGVEPPHDEVRRRGVSICGATLQELNLQVQAYQRARLDYRPHGNDPVGPFGQVRVCCFSRCQATARTATAAGSRPKRNAVRSLHIRCRMTRACGRLRHGPAPCLLPWRSSCPRRAGPTTCG